MPTYEYACPNCGIVEVFQSIKDDALKKCPQCKKGKVQRIVSVGGGVIFKGSGFWETDYNRSSDYAKKSKAESSESAPPDPAPKAQPLQKKSESTPSETKNPEPKQAEPKPITPKPPGPTKSEPSK